MLSVAGLRKVFAPRRRGEDVTVAIDGVDLEVRSGAFAAVLGASGSGKTTLLRCIAGFEHPDAGTISLGGRLLVGGGAPSVRSHARNVGVVPQEGALFPHMSVAQNVAFGLRGSPKAARHRRVDELLGMVGLADLAKRRPHELSGGQRQRIALARALAPEPQLILLDEPFSALDARLREDLRAEVKALLADLGSTALLVTHDQAEAMSMADHLVVMRAGRVVASGTPREVYEHPVDLEMAAFLGNASTLTGTVTRAGTTVRVRCALGELRIGNDFQGEGACRVMVRPEDLHLSDAASAVASEVVATAYHGSSCSLTVRLGGGEEVVVAAAGHVTAKVGDVVRIAANEPVIVFRDSRNHTPPPM